MPIFIPNLDFEFALDGTPPPGRLTRLLQELIPHLGLLLGEGDTLLSPIYFTYPEALSQARALPRVYVSPAKDQPWLLKASLPRALRGLEAFDYRAWGWDKRAHALVGDRKGGAGPSAEVVARVNSKLFSHGLERQLGWAMKDARAFGPGELEALLAHLATLEMWVIKGCQSTGGRGRLLGRGAIETKDIAFGERALRMGVVVEPWVERLGDYSLQIEISAEGEISILGGAKLLNKRGGQFLGVEVGEGAIPSEIYQELEAVGHQVGAALAKEGYWGPAGIDAFVYRGEDGTPRFRPLVEINARHTFGRVGLALGEMLRAGERGRWRLLLRGEAREALAAGGMLTSPETIGGRPAGVLGVFEVLGGV